jgi:lysozyme family protein
MSDFSKAIKVVLDHEGGYVNDKDDPGGETNYGLSCRFLVTLDPWWAHDWRIAHMTKPEATAIYLDHWWNPGHYGEITDTTLATKVFDMAVNMGAKQAVKLVQRALTDAGTQTTDDGMLGPVTIAALNAVNLETILNKIIARQIDFYRDLATHKPVLAKFLPGWSKRAAWPLGSQP